MTKIVFLNGPPGSGKDEAASYLEQVGPFPTDRFKFADPLRRMVPEAFGLSPKEWITYIEGSEKDKPQERLLGWTPRKLQIMASQDWLKPAFGKDFLGKVAAKKLQDTSVPLEMAVFSDCGFIEETEAVVKEFGVGNCTLVRLYRRGCNFDGDSRYYLDDTKLKKAGISGLATVDLPNNGTLDQFHQSLNILLD